MSRASVLTLGYGSFGDVNLIPTLGYGSGEAPTADPGWLGGGISDEYYALRKKQLEELQRIDDNIREGKKAALRALTEIDIPKEVKAPEIRRLDKQLLSDLRKIKNSEFNIQALLAEIALIREHILAQQIEAELFAREMDDEAAFLLMLN